MKVPLQITLVKDPLLPPIQHPLEINEFPKHISTIAEFTIKIKHKLQMNFFSEILEKLNIDSKNPRKCIVKKKPNVCYPL